MSYLEIYNENIKDLLNPRTGFLELREDQRDNNIQVVNLTEVTTNSTEEVMSLLQKGNKARTVEPTAANKTSSRSHALLSVTVRQTTSLQKSERMRARVKQARLFMIDLAGSERASNTKNSGKRLLEGAHINRSLLALGNCINALSGGARYVNYRDSKLTRLLKDALSGNSYTCMIAHVNPGTINREESRNTLLYADRAKNISNKVGQNILDISYHVSQYRTIISELRNEIARLKDKMTEEQETSRIYEDDEANGDKLNGINKLPRNIKSKKALSELLSSNQKLAMIKKDMLTTFKEQMRLRKKLLNIDSYLLQLGVEVEKQKSIISDWEGRNNKLYKNRRRSGYWLRNDQDDDDFMEVERDNTADTTVERAWSELSFLEKEHERYGEIKTSTERELENCKSRAAALEQDLPSSINSEEERELLRLIIRVHELEVEKMALQGERLTKQQELRQRDLMLLRYDRQRQICEEIITRQRQLMEEGRVSLPPDLQSLYHIYQQEIHSSAYTDSNAELTFSNERLPPIDRHLSSSRIDYFQRVDEDVEIATPISSAESEWRTTPYTGSHLPILPPPTVLFPPISKSLQEIRSDFEQRNSSISRLPRPVPNAR